MNRFENRLVRVIKNERRIILEKYCATCGTKIKGRYLKIGDNYLQAKYFDDEEKENIFCTETCLCQSLNTIEIDEDGESFPI